MHFTQTLATFLTVGVATAFKVRSFTEPDCGGTGQEINVWDNTCRDSDVQPTKSIRVLAYGGDHQRARFYNTGDTAECYVDDDQSWWADGGSNEFLEDACLNLPFEHGAEAFASTFG